MAALSMGNARHDRKITLEVFDALCVGLLFVGAIYLVKILGPDTQQLLMNGYLYTNRYIGVMKLLVLACGLFVLYSSRDYIVNHSRDVIEYPIMMSLALFFLLLLVGANHLMTMFLAISGFSLNMYVLVLFDASAHIAREAGIKYYYLSTMSTGFILYGTFIIYCYTHTGEFGEMNIFFYET